MSSKSAKHRKPKRVPARPAAPARHKKPSPIVTAIQNQPTRTAAAVTGAVLIAAAAPAVTHWAGSGVGQAAVLSQAGAPGPLGIHASPPITGRSAHPESSRQPTGRHHRKPAPAAAASAAHSDHPAAHPAHPRPAAPGRHRRRHHHHHRPAVTTVYQNPLRAVSGLIPERIDQGVDFSGSGPVYPIGDAVITNASGDNYGWPGGGWITYRLTDGPAAGLTVFVGEDVRPTVSAGQTVTPDMPIANMFEGGDGIETGWSMASGFTAESQMAEAGGISGAGPFPTKIGLNFDELLMRLGVPAANNRYAYPYGLLPAGYPADWPAALRAAR